MPSTRPLQWIEQAEAREVMTDAMFRQVPVAPWRQLARVKIAVWMRRLRRRVFSLIVPDWAAPQPRPVLVRRQGRRCRPVRRDADFC